MHTPIFISQVILVDVYDGLEMEFQRELIFVHLVPHRLTYHQLIGIGIRSLSSIVGIVKGFLVLDFLFRLLFLSLHLLSFVRLPEFLWVVARHTSFDFIFCTALGKVAMFIVFLLRNHLLLQPLFLFSGQCSTIISILIVHLLLFLFIVKKILLVICIVWILGLSLLLHALALAPALVLSSAATMHRSLLTWALR